PEEITVKAIAEEVIELVGSQSELKFLPLPQNDPKVREPDISRAKKLLGWQPKIDRHAGLKKTWAYFKTVVEK
ncbi:MAG: SDR family NAD-dependent epimerase/dehydratase, partial [Planctomycetes bacterium]|nr:SDR family NAD-dependent epimerase/dehydratase [Planctomycetota bacterium]